MENKMENESGSQTEKVVKKSFWNYSSKGSSTGFINSDAYLDPTFWTLVVSNLLVIIIIAVNKLPMSTILFVFFAESVIIGIFGLIRILCLSYFDLKEPKPTIAKRIGSIVTRIFFACICLIFYGIFYGFFNFIVQGSAQINSGILSLPIVLLIIDIFLINFLFSFIYLFKERTTDYVPDRAFNSDFNRIVPMSLSLVLMLLGGWVSFPVLFPVLFLRASVDIFSHMKMRKDKEESLIAKLEEEKTKKEPEKPVFAIDDKSLRNMFRDPSFWTLAFSNIYALYVILTNDVSLATVLIIYWFQSVTIGIFNVIRMLCLKDFVSGGLQSGGREVTNTTKDKVSAAFFFLVHYGIFHLAYLGFILRPDYSTGHFSIISWSSVIPVAIVFFLNHMFSFIYSFKEQTTNQNLGSLMFSPYARIIPMHIIIFVWASIGEAALVPFLLMKILLDLITHIFKHKTILVPAKPNV